jgi:ATP-binding cassette subfamily G (WHITE) protein 2 (PDR)
MRGAQMFLLVEAFLWFTSTFAQMVIAGIPTAETAGNIGNLLFSLSVSGDGLRFFGESGPDICFHPFS